MLAANVLWTYFLAGAEPVGVVDDRVEEILLKAYELSGDKIVETLKDWDKDAEADKKACGHEPATNGCAYRCGWYASDIVINSPGIGVIDATVFEEAWRKTRDDVHLTLDRLRAWQKKHNKKITDALLGNGC